MNAVPLGLRKNILPRQYGNKRITNRSSIVLSREQMVVLVAAVAASPSTGSRA